MLLFLYIQFRSLILLVADNGTGCTQQRQVSQLFRVARTASLISDTNVACSRRLKKTKEIRVAARQAVTRDGI